MNIDIKQNPNNFPKNYQQKKSRQNPIRSNIPISKSNQNCIHTSYTIKTQDTIDNHKNIPQFIPSQVLPNTSSMDLNQDPELNLDNINFKHTASRPIYKASSSRSFKSNNNITFHSTSDLRINNVEGRLETVEKMLKFYIRLINIRNEKNNYSFLNEENINLMIKRIDYLEESISKMNNYYSKQFEELYNKIDNIEKIINIQEDNLNNVNNVASNLKNKSFIENNIQKNMNQGENEVNSININSEIDNNLINDLNDKINNINQKLLLIENIINEKEEEFDSIRNYKKENDIKIKELLNLIKDLNKVCEKSENGIKEICNNLKKFQKENVDILKEISIHSVKVQQIEYLTGSITELKKKYSHIISMLNNNEKEEQNFVNDYTHKSNSINDLNEQENEVNNENDNQNENENGSNISVVINNLYKEIYK